MIAEKLMSAAINSLMRLSPAAIEAAEKDSWRLMALGDLLRKKKRLSNDDATLVPFLPMASISDGFSGENSPELREWISVKSGYTTYETGDVLLAKITPCFQNRKSTIAPESTSGIGAGTTELLVLRPSSILLPEYLLWFVKSDYLIDQMIGKMTGTAGQKRVPIAALEQALIPVPELKTQQKIVGVLNSLLEPIRFLAELERERERGSRPQARQRP